MKEGVPMHRTLGHGLCGPGRTGEIRLGLACMTEAALGRGGDSQLVWFPPLRDWSRDSDRSVGTRESLVGKARGPWRQSSPSPGTDYSWGGPPQVNRVPTLSQHGPDTAPIS